MELNREQIKKELGLFIDDNPVELHLHHKKTSKLMSFLKLVLAVITTDEQKIFELENRLKECANGYEGTLFLDSCKLHDAEVKINELTVELNAMRGAANSYKMHIIELEKEQNALTRMLVARAEDISRLTEENERLRQNNLVFEQGVEKVAANYYNLGCADTVRKMHSMLCEGRVSNDTVVIVANQVAKEMLGEQDNES